MLDWAVKCTCATTGLSRRQNQLTIKALNSKNDPMVVYFYVS